MAEPSPEGRNTCLQAEVAGKVVCTVVEEYSFHAGNYFGDFVVHQNGDVAPRNHRNMVDLKTAEVGQSTSGTRLLRRGAVQIPTHGAGRNAVVFHTPPRWAKRSTVAQEPHTELRTPGIDTPVDSQFGLVQPYIQPSQP